MFPRRNRYIFSYQKKKRAATIKRIITTIIAIILVLVVLFFAFVIYNSKIHIKLASDRNIEVNTPATASQFIENIGNGELVQDVDIDTSTVGAKDCNVKINVAGDIRDYNFTVNIVDTQPPVIAMKDTELSLLEGTPLDVVSRAEITDNSGEELQVSVEGGYDPYSSGTQTVTLVARDSSGNRANQELTVNVIGITNDMPDCTFLTQTGHDGEIRNGILYVDGILVVNKSFGLPEEYNPGMTSETMDAYYKMVSSAWDSGFSVNTVTEFRSYWDQDSLFQYWAYVQGEGVDTPTAVKAGHSEHQTGLAMDIGSAEMSYAGTAEAKWLSDHCAEFGFIMRYPEGKEEFTGCSWEPWHIRYVGTDLAKKLYNNGDWITLEEYFGIPSKYVD